MCARAYCGSSESRKWSGRYAVADQPEWYWEPIDDGHLNCHISSLTEGLGGVDPCRPAPTMATTSDDSARRCTLDQLNTTDSTCDSARSCS